MFGFFGLTFDLCGEILPTPLHGVHFVSVSCPDSPSGGCGESQKEGQTPSGHETSPIHENRTNLSINYYCHRSVKRQA